MRLARAISEDPRQKGGFFRSTGGGGAEGGFERRAKSSLTSSTRREIRELAAECSSAERGKIPEQRERDLRGGAEGEASA